MSKLSSRAPKENSKVENLFHVIWQYMSCSGYLPHGRMIINGICVFILYVHALLSHRRSIRLGSRHRRATRLSRRAFCQEMQPQGLDHGVEFLQQRQPHAESGSQRARSQIAATTRACIHKDAIRDAEMIQASIINMPFYFTHAKHPAVIKCFRSKGIL